MAVNTFGFPMPQAFSGGADFTPLANLGNVIREGRAQQNQYDVLSKMGPDPMQNAMLMIQSKDPRLATTGIQYMNQLTTQKRLEAQQAEETRQFNITSGLAQKKFEADSKEARQNDLDAEIAQGRLPPEAAKDPEWARWVVTGKDPPNQRVGLGAPIITERINPQTGQPERQMYQLSSGGGAPVPIKFGQGERPLMPGEIAQEKTEGVSMGKARANAIQALPGVEDLTTNNIATLEALKTHKGREAATGPWNAFLYSDENPMLGSEGIGFRSLLKQAKSQAFLEAYKVMRGAGAISNVEGDKGAQSVLRLSAAMDKDEFNNAIKDAQDIYKLGLERMRRAAKGDFSSHPAELRPTDYRAPTGPSGSLDEALGPIFKKR